MKSVGPIILDYTICNNIIYNSYFIQPVFETVRTSVRRRRGFFFALLLFIQLSSRRHTTMTTTTTTTSTTQPRLSLSLWPRPPRQQYNIRFTGTWFSKTAISHRTSCVVRVCAVPPRFSTVLTPVDGRALWPPGFCDRPRRRRTRISHGRRPEKFVPRADRDPMRVRRAGDICLWPGKPVTAAPLPLQHEWQWRHSHFTMVAAL